MPISKVREFGVGGIIMYEKELFKIISFPTRSMVYAERFLAYNIMGGGPYTIKVPIGHVEKYERPDGRFRMPNSLFASSEGYADMVGMVDCRNPIEKLLHVGGCEGNMRNQVMRKLYTPLCTTLRDEFRWLCRITSHMMVTPLAKNPVINPFELVTVATGIAQQDETALSILKYIITHDDRSEKHTKEMAENLLFGHADHFLRGNRKGMRRAIRVRVTMDLSAREIRL